MPGECPCGINEHCVSNITLTLIAIGVIMTLTSLLWPIDPYYEPNQYLTAQENENLQQKHAQTLTILDTVSAVGLGLLTLGAIITSVLLTKVIVIDECSKSSRGKKQQGDQQGDHQQPPRNETLDSQVNGQQHAQLNMKVGPTLELVKLSGAKHPGEPTHDKDRLVDSDQLEINTDFSHVKLYGSLGN